MLLLSLFVESGQCPGTGLTRADKTSIQLQQFLFGDSQWGAPGFQGREKAPLPPLNATLQTTYVKTKCIHEVGYRVHSLECGLWKLQSLM